jgi:tight adherence protein C
VAYAPAHWVQDAGMRQRLVRAGFGSNEAPLIYAGVRVALLVALPASATLLVFGRPVSELALAVIIALAAAWLVPVGILHGLIRRRQERVRSGIPDALDLLLVCVEAGSSLESAIERVAHDALAVYPELAGELTAVARKMKAGVPRADALRELYARTGVEELRVIISSLVQSERWGTGVAKALHLCAERLRRERRQSAERHASAAPIKLAIPLVTMILPALLVTLLGPSLLVIIKALRGW